MCRFFSEDDFYPLRPLVVNGCPSGGPSRGSLGILGRDPWGPWPGHPPGYPPGPWRGHPKGGKCLLSMTQNCHFPTNVPWMPNPAQSRQLFSEDDFYPLRPLPFATISCQWQSFKGPCPGHPLGSWMCRPKGRKCLLSMTQNCHFQTNVQ